MNIRLPNIANNNKPQVTRTRIYWQFLTFILSVFMILLCVRWMVENPGTASMDEAVYQNQVHEDRTAFENKGLRGLARKALYNDRARPPAYRWFVMPLIPVTDNATLLMFRLVSLASFIIALIFLYLGTAKVAGYSGAAFAALMVILSPIVLVSVKNFGTTYPLLLAITAMFYFLFNVWDRSDHKWYHWLGLGIALAIGALAKLTFVLVAAPAILLTLYYSVRKQISGPSPGFIMKAIVTGVLISVPWWVINFQRAIDYAVYASGSGNPRHTLGFDLWDKLNTLPTLYAVTAVGPALTVLFLVALAILLLQFINKRSSQLNQAQSKAVWVCLLSFLPMFLIHVTGSNQNMRYIIVPYIPLLIAMAIMIAGSGLIRKPVFIFIASLLFIFQAYQISASFDMQESDAKLRAQKRGYFGGGPSEIMARRDDTQWNWEKLHALVESHHIIQPKIVMLGGGSAFNPPHIHYPWVKRGVKIKAKRMWRYEFGDIDWVEIQKQIKLSDIVITAPDFIGDPLDKQDLDNQHNKALVALMDANSEFMAPVEIWQGKSSPVKFLVYIRRPEGLLNERAQR